MRRGRSSRPTRPAAACTRIVEVPSIVAERWSSISMVMARSIVAAATFVVDLVGQLHGEVGGKDPGGRHGAVGRRHVADSVADAEMLDVGAHRGDYAGGFTAGDAGRGERVVHAGADVDVMEVDTDCSVFDDDLARRRGR